MTLENSIVQQNQQHTFCRKAIKTFQLKANIWRNIFGVTYCTYILFIILEDKVLLH